MKEIINKCCKSKEIIIVIIVIFAVFYAIGIYLLINNNAETEKHNLNAKITELQNQISNINNITNTKSNILTDIAIDKTVSSTPINDDISTWMTATLPDLNVSFKYPSEWGNYSIYDHPGEVGVTRVIAFDAAPTNIFDMNKALITYTSDRFSAGRSESMSEVYSARDLYRETPIKSCNDFFDYDAFYTQNTKCKEIKTELGTAYLMVIPCNDDMGCMIDDYTGVIIWTKFSTYPTFSIQKLGISSTEINIIKKILSSIEIIK